jgi:5S rRNA maturation endonuclease (ribonuclease M5)
MLAAEKRKLVKRLLRLLSNSTVLVEGKKDAMALSEFCAAKTIPFAGREEKAIGACVESGVTRVVVLSDFDEEGRKSAERVSEALLAQGISPDARLRKLFRAALGANRVEESSKRFFELKEELGLDES